MLSFEKKIVSFHFSDFSLTFNVSIWAPTTVFAQLIDDKTFGKMCKNKANFAKLSWLFDLNDQINQLPATFLTWNAFSGNPSLLSVNKTIVLRNPKLFGQKLLSSLLIFHLFLNWDFKSINKPNSLSKANFAPVGQSLTTALNIIL